MNRIAAVTFFLSVLLGYNLYDNFDPDVLVGKRVLVTGASTGIGEQMAYHYARMGAQLLITARTETKLQKVIEHCREVGDKNGNYHYIKADMGEMEDTRRVIEKAEMTLGGLDFLILNHIIIADLGEWLGKPDNLTLLDRTLDINFKAYVSLTSYAMPLLEKTHGSIVVVSSIAGRIAQPYLVSYSASKFALDGFFSGLRQEFILRNIDVSITFCIIGLIGTKNTVEKLTEFEVHNILTTFPVAKPEDAGMAIIKGGARREREVFFPYIEARVPTLLRDWMPRVFEALLRYSFARS